MRIIAGSARGRRLKTPNDELTRPTSDRLKESLFSILTPNLVEAQVLDVFSGSGAFGLESISRGAAYATMIELRPEAAKVIRDNVISCGFAAQTQLIEGDALVWLKMLRLPAAVDLIFLDPPYQLEMAEEAVKVIADAKWLKPSTLLIIEHHKTDALPQQFPVWQRYRQIRQGESVISFYRYESAREAEELQ